MKLESLMAVVAKFKVESPKSLLKDLEDVEIMLAPNVEAARKSLADLLALSPEESDTERTESTVEPPPVVPDDCKGLFLGEPMEKDIDEDDPETETVELAEGVILLIAANLADEEEAAVILMHEVGHALGYSEADVAALGLGGVPSKELPQ